MLMLITTLLTSNVFAGGFGGFVLGSGLCNGRPCTSMLDGNTTIVPSDMYELMARDAGGRLDYFRVDLEVTAGEIVVDVNGYTLDRNFLSTSESTSSHLVYYVPASPGAKIVVTNIGKDAAGYQMDISGYSKAR